MFPARERLPFCGFQKGRRRKEKKPAGEASAAGAWVSRRDASRLRDARRQVLRGLPSKAIPAPIPPTGGRLYLF